LIFTDEAAVAGAPVPFLTINSVAPTIMAFGTEEQKKFYLPGIARGDIHFSIGYSEPGAGTDLAALRTTAVRDGEDYVVNGQKMWTSLIQYADYVWLAVRTNTEAKKHRETMDALTLCKADMGQYVRLYVFLSQIFNYGNSDVEKRAIFFRRLLPLLEFGRERDDIDLSSVRLTHYTLKNQGTTRPDLRKGDSPKLEPITGAGSGSMQEKVKARLSEIIEKVNELFEGDLTDDDKLIYVNNVLKGKLLENETLRQQAASNSKARFEASPDLNEAVLDAVIAARSANERMSLQAINDDKVRKGLVDILVNFTDLYELLRADKKAG
jgi:hypothetical protein